MADWAGSGTEAPRVTPKMYVGEYDKYVIVPATSNYEDPEERFAYFGEYFQNISGLSTSTDIPDGYIIFPDGSTRIAAGSVFGCEIFPSFYLPNGGTGQLEIIIGDYEYEYIVTSNRGIFDLHAGKYVNKIIFGTYDGCTIQLNYSSEKTDGYAIYKLYSLVSSDIAKLVKNAYLGIGDKWYLEEVPNSTVTDVWDTMGDNRNPNFWYNKEPIDSSGNLLSPSIAKTMIWILGNMMNAEGSSGDNYTFVDFGPYLLKFYNVSPYTSVTRAPEIYNKYNYTATKYYLRAKPNSNGKAHKVKKGYVGVKTNFPIYENQTTTKTVNITNSNLSEYFEVTNGSYYFKGDSSSSKFTASNLGVNSSSATTTLKAKKAINNFNMSYGYTSEQNYDKFTFKYNSTTVENTVSGTLASKAWTKNLAAGDTLAFTYSKDSSSHASGETCWFGDMTCTDQVQTQVQVGTETKEVARLFFKSGPKIVSWATGTDEEVAAMIQAAHDGDIKLADYWKVGDTRTVSLSAGKNSAGTAIPAQSVELVLVHKPTSTSYYGGGEFIINQKNCLTVDNYMNSSSTNSGSFNGSAMASFLNNTSTGYLAMLPAWLRNVLLNAKVITAQTYNGTTNQTSTHKVFLPAAKEIFGGTASSAGSGTSYSNLTEFNALEQWEWFKTSANRIKQINGSNNYWWERSPYYNASNIFCSVHSSGSAYKYSANGSHGVAPAMLI